MAARNTAMQVDGMPSTWWLKQRTAHFKLPYRTFVNLPRDKAIALIQEEGFLLVLCTMVEVCWQQTSFETRVNLKFLLHPYILIISAPGQNAPYVIAEASALNIPYVAFSVGGVEELFISSNESGGS